MRWQIYKKSTYRHTRLLSFLWNFLSLNMINLRDKKILRKFGQHVRQLREASGLTQEQLANDMNVEISQISRIELGKVNTSLCTIVKLAEMLKISPSKLLEVDFKVDKI
jgi:ribosome-binding protein aMBF1 (putative translation factor)